MTTLRSLAKYRGWELPVGPESIPTGISWCSRHVRESSTIRLARHSPWLSNWLEEFPQPTPSVSIERRKDGPLVSFLQTYTRIIFERHATTRKPPCVWKSTPGSMKER